MDIQLHWRLTGGISTLRPGFQFCEVPRVENNDLPKYLLANSNGEVFASFWEDKKEQHSNDCDRAELEAIEGFKRLILKW